MLKIDRSSIVADIRKNGFAYSILTIIPILFKESYRVGLPMRSADNLPNLPTLTMVTILFVLTCLTIKYVYLGWISIINNN